MPMYPHTFTVCLQLLENDEMGVLQTHSKCLTEKGITLSDPLFTLQQEVTSLFYDKVKA